MRGLGRGHDGWTVVLVVAVLVGLATVSAKLWLPTAVAAGAAALIAIVAGVWTSWSTNALTERDKQKRGMPGLVLLDHRGRLPQIRDLDDPVALGVHPAATIREGGLRPRMPVFVPRDITPQLYEAIQQDRFVLIVGESTAGKTRLAYETIRALLTEHRLIEPVGRAALQVAVPTVRETSHCVLWLDDLERFLGSDGLSGADVKSILNAPGKDRFILATMRAEECAKYTGRVGNDSEKLSREAIRHGWEVLRLATRLNLSRSWSQEELARAVKHGDDPRISEALDHADRFGLAEYIAAGPQLLAEWQDAWAPGTHPRGAALVDAAVDARRVGIHRPLSLSALSKLHEYYLDHRGGRLLRPEPLEEALAWATTPLHATSSLLLPAGEDAYLAFDYLIGAVGRVPISAETLTALLACATPDETMEIGEIAWQWHHLAVAELAFHRAQDDGNLVGTRRRCHLLRERDGSTAGLRFAQEELESHLQELGPEHPDTLELQNILAWETGISGDPESALVLLRRLEVELASTLGKEHKKTLEARSGIAHWTGEAGDHASSVILYAMAAKDCARILGNEDPLTIVNQERAAIAFGEAGDPAKAATLLQELLDGEGAQSQQPGDLQGLRARLAIWTMKSGDHTKALGLWEQLVAETLAGNSRFHLQSLWIRMEHAECVGTTGDPAGAARLLHDVMADASQLEGPPSTNVLAIGRRLATWTGEAGSPTEAVEQLQHLVTISTQQRGARDIWTLALRRHLAHWTGHAGDPHSAVRQLGQLIIDAESDDTEAQASCQALIHWSRRADDRSSL